VNFSGGRASSLLLAGDDHAVAAGGEEILMVQCDPSAPLDPQPQERC
jgi:hypothetical protein